MNKKIRSNLIALAVSAGLLCAALSMLITARLHNPRQPVKKTPCFMLNIRYDAEKKGLDFSWDCRNCEPTSYQPFRRVNNGDEELLQAVPPREKHFTDQAVISGELYSYAAAAYDSSQKQGERLGIKAEPMFYYYDTNQPEMELTDYSPMLNISTNENGLLLSWGNTPNIPITGYLVERNIDDSWEVVSELPGDITQYPIDSALCTYRLSVFRKVRDEVVYSKCSNAVEANAIYDTIGNAGADRSATKSVKDNEN